MQSEVFEAIDVTEEVAEQRPELVCCCCFKKCEEVSENACEHVESRICAGIEGSREAIGGPNMCCCYLA